MATRKRTAPKGKGRGGQSGGANPRNDGRITEQQHDDAMRVLRAEYYQGIRSIAQDIGERVKSGEITDQDGLDRALRESVNGSYWVIYTHANLQVLLCSDNHDAYQEYGEPRVPDDSIDWAYLAYMAMERDVQQQIDAEGITVEQERLDERRRLARRGPPTLGSRARRR